MCPRTTDQLTKIRQEKKKIILDTALRLFAEQGYHKTTIQLIAKEAGISKGLVYNYFESKESLLNEIFTLGMNELTQDLELDKDGILTREKLIYYINITFLKLKGNTIFYQLFFSLIIQPQVFSIFQDKFLNLIIPFLNILEKYYETKGIKYSGAMSHLFGAVLDGVGIDYIVNRNNFPLEDVKKLVIEMFT